MGTRTDDDTTRAPLLNDRADNDMDVRCGGSALGRVVEGGLVGDGGEAEDGRVCPAPDLRTQAAAAGSARRSRTRPTRPADRRAARAVLSAAWSAAWLA